MPEPAINAEQRPIDTTPVHTDDLPLTPLRDRNIEVSSWIEAPRDLIDLHLTLPPEAPDQTGAGRTRRTFYKRRIGPWLLWRTGPAARDHARYWAGHKDDLSRSFTFRLHPDGTGSGIGPSGRLHDRFRDWKLDLKAHPDQHPDRHPTMP